MSEAQVPETPLRSFPCRQCGARLEYVPGTATLKCPYCETENTIQTAGEVAEVDFLATLAALEEEAAHEQVRLLKCGGCGAEVTPPPRATSLACPFCATNLVAQFQEASRVRPHAVLPFVIPREKAVALFREWVRSRWFAPNALKNESLIDEQLLGMYIPAWTYDTRAETSYRGERGTAYYVSVGTGKNRRTVRRVRWTPASGLVVNGFDDVLVLASRSLPEKLLHVLEPWDLKQAIPYADEWLAGFRAECYQISLPAGWELAQQIMAPHIDDSIRSDIGGDEQRIAWKHSDHLDTTFKYMLLPLWVSAYRWRGKVYRFLVNARTGEVQGQRPYSKVKIAAAALLALIFAIIVLYFLRR